MGWLLEVTILFLVQYLATTRAHSINLPNQNEIENDVHLPINNFEDGDGANSLNRIEDFQLDQLGKVLASILVQPWPRGVSPLLYVEEFPEDESDENEMNAVPIKRSRYYRKYPWKRQNSRYDAENRYLCQPSKEDVFRLLVALHEARQGNKGQTVNFCNRKRPASAVFTNIRFLG